MQSLKIIIAILLAAYVVVRLAFIFKKRGIRAMLISIAVLLAGCYIGFGVLLYFMQPKLLYYPVREVATTPGELGCKYEDVFFTTADGVKLNGWYVPAKDSRLTVLYCHGNGGNIGYYLDTIDILHKMNVNCFVFDYRGYGLSEGKPTEEGTYADALAAYKWLVSTKGAVPNKIVISGWSLGGCIAAELASKVKAGGLLLESTFTSYADMASYHYPYLPVRWFCRYKYDTLGYLRNVHCPVMAVHSPDDEIAPFAMGQKLFAAANEPKEFVQIAGSHNEGFIESALLYSKRVGAWLESLEGRQLKEAAR
jgi:fermentation-respiration switch protein FrsA (DUF1100 family)